MTLPKMEILMTAFTCLQSFNLYTNFSQQIHTSWDDISCPSGLWQNTLILLYLAYPHPPTHSHTPLVTPIYMQFLQQDYFLDP